MPGEWKEVVRLRFTGKRFDDHALDLTALAELGHFQQLLAETAKSLWRARNPSRERLPAHFEDRTRLCLRSIEEGSATTPLEVLLEEPDEKELFPHEPPEELTNAVDVAYRVFAATQSEGELPEELPKDLVAEYARWGETLGDDESIELRTPSRERAVTVNKTTGTRLAARCEAPYVSTVDVLGEVIEADVRHRKFQVWMPAGYPVNVAFSEAEEAAVTTALKEHAVVRLSIRGIGEFASDGRLRRITRLDDLTIVPVGEPRFDRTARSIEDELADLAAAVPAESWDALPADLSSHLDDYLDGLRG
jgi:hypothetical protein